MDIKTKIIATIGPACDNIETLQSMLDAGVNAFRLNMSHGDETSKRRLYSLVQSLKMANGQRPCILTDLAGPKIRITDVLPDFNIETGQAITITNENSADKNHISVTDEVCFTNVSQGAKILINDGRIQLEVVEATSNHSLKCHTQIGGLVEPGKGVNFPGITLDVPTLTDQDRTDLKMALDLEADWIALSFVRSAEDLDEVLAIMDEAGKHLPVMAKIEKLEALNNVEAITKSFDAVMVARGDLGVEIPPEQVPLAQKKIINIAGVLGKPVVIATQMLESMIESQTPTRAEVSDIANAIFDGVDALMVTGETAAGNYPIDVIRTLKGVISEIEYSAFSERKTLPKNVTKTADAISHAVCQIALDLDIKLILSMTHSGSTAKMISRYRPQASILALTPFDHIARQLQLVWGVIPAMVSKYNSIEAVPKICNAILTKLNVIEKNTCYVITGGVPTGMAGTTNYLSVQTY